MEHRRDAQFRSARADLLDDSVDAVLLVVDWSLLIEPLVVPLAPVLEVLGLVELVVPLAPMLEVLGLVELVELLGVLLVEPVALASVDLLVDEAVVPPLPAALEPDEPPVCAIAKPPMASAAAAANVVSVFLVVVMSIAP